MGELDISFLSILAILHFELISIGANGICGGKMLAINARTISGEIL